MCRIPIVCVNYSHWVNLRRKGMGIDPTVNCKKTSKRKPTQSREGYAKGPTCIIDANSLLVSSRCDVVFVTQHGVDVENIIRTIRSGYSSRIRYVVLFNESAWGGRIRRVSIEKRGWVV